MSIPAAKRQRTDAASYALSKPFRSPMKMPSTASTNKAPTLVQQDSSDPARPGANDATKPLEPTKYLLQHAATPSRTKTTKKPFLSLISSTVHNADPDIAALVKAQRQLEKQLRELKEELDIAEQARRIEADSEKKSSGGAVDGELTQLVVMWRAASRQAAEELFTGVRDRVNRYAMTKLLIWHSANKRSLAALLLT
jgi:Swi5-dependent recombination DNA repair protein 1